MNDPLQTRPSEENQSDWSPCPSGKVVGLVGKLKHRRRMQTIKQAGATAACLLALVVLGRTLLPNNDPALTSLSHAEVVELSQDYIEGNLDENTIRQVEAHIDLCPRCAHLREERKAYLERQTWIDREDASRAVAHLH